MKHVKVLGPVAAATMVAMACVGASWALAADVLCENNTSTPCNAKVAVNGIIKAEATTAVITSDPHPICEKSTLTLKVTKNDGIANPTGEVTGLSWTNCATAPPFPTNCNFTTQNLPYHFEVTTPGPNLKIKGKSGNPGVEVVCGTEVNCTFSKAEFSLVIDSGNPVSFTANGIPLEMAGSKCPPEAAWDANYFGESPTGSIWVRNS
jgi:hypothetical protein